MITVHTLRKNIVDYVSAVSSEMENGGWWREPILATGVADGRFASLKRSVSSDHLLPEDLVPGAQAVITFFLPFIESPVRENRGGELACWNWGQAYVQTNSMISDLSSSLMDLLKKHGCSSAATPPTHNFDKVKLLSPWSHKHLAHLTGLGRFGVHAQIITPSGAAGRLGSLVTDAPLGDEPVCSTEEMCLHLAGSSCLACVTRCPPGVLLEGGLDRQGCYRQCLVNDRNLADLPTTDVCGKCVAVVPCSFKNPVD